MREGKSRMTKHRRAAVATAVLALAGSIAALAAFSSSSAGRTALPLPHPTVTDYQFVASGTTPPTVAQCAAVGLSCFTPQAIQSAYNVGPLHRAGQERPRHHDRDRRLVRQRHDGARPACLRPGVRPRADVRRGGRHVRRRHADVQRAEPPRLARDEGAARQGHGIRRTSARGRSRSRSTSRRRTRSHRARTSCSCTRTTPRRSACRACRR